MVKKYKILKNLKKSEIFKPNFFLAEKKMPFPLFSHLRRLDFDHSSPVQPVAELGGGPLSVTEDGNPRV